MKLEANLEVVNNMANHKGYKKVPPCFCQLSFAKDSASNKFFLIVNSTKKPHADKYRVVHLEHNLKLAEFSNDFFQNFEASK